MTKATHHNWFEVNLRRAYDIASVAITSQTAHPEWLVNITIIGSNDPYENLTGKEEICASHPNEMSAGMTILPCNKILLHKQYVIIDQVMSLYKVSLALCEVEVIPAGLFNAALKRPVTSSSVNFDGPPEKAVDGNANPVYELGFCMHTEYTPHNYLTVDLGQPLNITEVAVHQRTDQAWTLKHFTIFGTNKAYSGKDVDDMEVCAAETVQLEEGEVRWYVCSKKIYKRYAVISQKFLPEGNLVLCEFQVIAECLNGRWGANCYNICSTNCLTSDNCDKANGVCLGCKQRFYGERCDKVCHRGCFRGFCDQFTGECSCEIGHYGVNCTKKCPGHCERNVCNRWYGNCSSCKAGYYGALCNKTCPRSCANKGCRQKTGACECKTGYFGIDCDQAWMLLYLNVAAFKGPRLSSDFVTAALGYPREVAVRNKRQYKGFPEVRVCTRTKATHHNWFQVNLWGIYDIAEIAITNQRFKPDWLTNITIFGSNHRYEDLTGEEELCTRHSSPLSPAITFLPCTKILLRKQYVIIDQWMSPGKIPLVLCEVEVIPAGLFNAAMYRPATSSSEMHNGFPSKAVDGNANPVFNDGFCMHTETTPHNYLCVDLGQPLNITETAIHQRTDYAWSLNFFMIFGTNKEYRGGNVDDFEMCAREMVSIRPGFVNWYVCPKKMHKRYAVISQKYTPRGALVLCEFQVVAECPNGRWGAHCFNFCSRNCLNPLECKKSNGVCKGCKRGIFGDYCDKACPANCASRTCHQFSGYCACELGRYGPNCNRTCPGNCVNGNCERWTGNCEACKSGFYGAFCDKACPHDCKNKRCKRRTGACDCLTGYFGVDCNQAMLLLYLNVAEFRGSRMSSEFIQKSSQLGYPHQLAVRTKRQYKGFPDVRVCAKTKATHHNWFEVNLWRKYDIAEIAVTNQRYHPAWLMNITIIASNRPYGQGGEICASHSVSMSPGMTVLPCKKIMLGRQYVILDQWMSIRKVPLAVCEIEVIPAGLFNAAMYRPATSSSVNHKAGPDRAVDGNANPVFNDGFCMHTMNTPHNYLCVDLGQPLNITEVAIQQRTDYVRSLNHFIIFGTNNQYTGQNIDDMESCGRESKNHLSASQLRTYFCPTKIYKRYAVISQKFPPRGNLVLCEFLVIAECAKGNWGAHCYHSCSLNCSDPLECDRSTGICKTCREGVHGKNCDKACPVNCKGNVCDRDMGVCMSCNNGSWGKDCSIDCKPECKQCSQNTGACRHAVEGTKVTTTKPIYPVMGNIPDCTGGKWGFSCDRDCPADCPSNCDTVTGKCPDTIKPVAYDSSQPSTSQTLSLVFTNSFSPTWASDPETAYSVIVSTDRRKPSTSSAKTWAEVQGIYPQPAFIAIYHCQEFFDVGSECEKVDKKVKRQAVATSKTVTAVIGGDSCTILARETYCNGPLLPNTSYYITLKAEKTKNQILSDVFGPFVTIPKVISDSELSNMAADEKKTVIAGEKIEIEKAEAEAEAKSSKKSVAPIVAPVLAVVVVVLGIGVYIFWRRSSKGGYGIDKNIAQDIAVEEEKT